MNAHGLNMLPSSKTTSATHSSKDFLKLENVFSFDGEKMNVGTLLFDASTDKARSKNIFNRVFGKIMEWRAKEWVKDYVRKNTAHLPGSEEFLKSIKSSKGVRRDEFMGLLVAAKLQRSEIFSVSSGVAQGLKNNLSIEKPTANVINFISNLIDSDNSRPSVEFFFNFVEKGFVILDRRDVSKGLDFLEKFNGWSKNNENNIFLKMMKGYVNFFQIELEKKITEFDLDDDLESIEETQNYGKMKKMVKYLIWILIK